MSCKKCHVRCNNIPKEDAVWNVCPRCKFYCSVKYYFHFLH